jgi:SAM-dependent methyltransferase
MFSDFSKQRITGKIYSKFFLYPRIKRLLNGHVIDYGAGIGNFTKYYMKFNKITPAEINLDCLNYMKNLGLNPLKIENDHILIKDNSFDSALLDNVLEHVLDPPRVINEVKRLVKRNGIIVIGVPGILGFNFHWDHKYFFDEIELKKLCKNFNLDLIKFMYAPFFKSNFLSLNMRQYCIYAQIRNTK